MRGIETACCLGARLLVAFLVVAGVGCDAPLFPLSLPLSRIPVSGPGPPLFRGGHNIPCQSVKDGVEKGKRDRERDT